MQHVRVQFLLGIRNIIEENKPEKIFYLLWEYLEGNYPPIFPDCCKKQGVSKHFSKVIKS